MQVLDHDLEVRAIPASRPGRPAIVFLHEGIGSVSMWRDYPDRVARATGCAAFVYSRYGYGQSDVLAEPRRPLDYMNAEALEVLPALLAALGVERPVLYGHSDGASIALMYAGRFPARAIIVEAPHVFVEDESIAGIVAAKQAFESTDLPQRLARHHRDPARTFRGWNDAWLDPGFRGWNIEAFLPGIACPVLAIQGWQDNYGTMAQLDAIARQVGGDCETLRLPECGHSPHRDRTADVLAAVSAFIDKL